MKGWSKPIKCSKEYLQGRQEKEPDLICSQFFESSPPIWILLKFPIRWTKVLYFSFLLFALNQVLSTLGLPMWLSGKESTCQWRGPGFDPWVRKIPWRSKWQPTPVFLPGKSRGQRSLAGYSPWGWKRVGFSLSWAHTSLQMVTAAMKLKDSYSLEEKLGPT